MSQYSVSGVVEFSYHDYETKIGNVTTSNQYWTQNYRANLQGDVWDPRFLKFSGGVGYTVYSYKNGQDARTLNYDLNTSFFPGMKYSWNLFGSKSITNVASSTNIAGYDVTSTSYGGTLFLHLNSRGGNGNNSNNTNNNSNNSGRSSLFLPDITLSRIHSESESQSLLHPLRERRDNTSAALAYRFTGFDLSLDGGLEQYKNLINQSSYETKTANLNSNIQVSPEGNLRVHGNLTDRQTENIPGFNLSDRLSAYGLNLNFKEKNGFQHYYTYDFSEEQNSSFDLIAHRASARAIYRLSEELRIQGGLDYNLSDYTRQPTSTPGDIGEKDQLESGGLLAGAMYRKKYAPDFMGPFVLDTDYDFNLGFSKLTSQTGGPQGSGLYYTNNVNIGLSSAGWDKDNVGLSYNYNNKRDHSPVANDMWQQSIRFTALTKRVTNTTIRGTATYMTQENKTQAGTVFFNTPNFLNQQIGVNQQNRSFTYDASIEHIVSAYLNLTVGATRGQITTSSYTLSTLVPVSTTKTEDQLYYGQANFSYPITRMLLYRAQLREELRRVQSASTESHQVNMNLDYRIRSIFINLEARWREDVPEGGLKSQQQYYFIKVSRPF